MVEVSPAEQLGLAINQLGQRQPLSVGEALAWQANAGGEVGRGVRPPLALVWRAQRTLIVTRREARLANFAAVSRVMAEEGWPVHIRESGGGAFPVGPGTVMLTLLLPRDDKHSLEVLYATLSAPILSMLGSYRVAASVDAVPGSFCSGRHDIAVAGRKIGGMAQRWSGGGGRGFAMASAAVIVDEDPEELSATVNRFYARCGVQTRCNSGAVTSLCRQLSPVNVGVSLERAAMETLVRCIDATSIETAFAGLSRSHQTHSA